MQLNGNNMKPVNIFLIFISSIYLLFITAAVYKTKQRTADIKSWNENVTAELMAARQECAEFRFSIHQYLMTGDTNYLVSILNSNVILYVPEQ